MSKTLVKKDGDDKSPSQNLDVDKKSKSSLNLKGLGFEEATNLLKPPPETGVKETKPKAGSGSGEKFVDPPMRRPYMGKPAAFWKSAFDGLGIELATLSATSSRGERGAAIEKTVARYFPWLTSSVQIAIANVEKAGILKATRGENRARRRLETVERLGTNIKNHSDNASGRKGLFKFASRLGATVNGIGRKIMGGEDSDLQEARTKKVQGYDERAMESVLPEMERILVEVRSFWSKAQEETTANISSLSFVDGLKRALGSIRRESAFDLNLDD